MLANYWRHILIRISSAWILSLPLLQERRQWRAGEGREHGVVPVRFTLRFHHDHLLLRRERRLIILRANCACGNGTQPAGRIGHPSIGRIRPVTTRPRKAGSAGSTRRDKRRKLRHSAGASPGTTSRRAGELGVFKSEHREIAVIPDFYRAGFFVDFQDFQHTFPLAFAEDYRLFLVRLLSGAISVLDHEESALGSENGSDAG